jgi:hypothetical protein
MSTYGPVSLSNCIKGAIRVMGIVRAKRVLLVIVLSVLCSGCLTDSLMPYGMRGQEQSYWDAYPFTGPGLYVYCGAGEICGRRGGNALPGNWGWTSGLFGDLKQNYPQVMCNLYPGSCRH